MPDGKPEGLLGWLHHHRLLLLLLLPLALHLNLEEQVTRPLLVQTSLSENRDFLKFSFEVV